MATDLTVKIEISNIKPSSQLLSYALMLSLMFKVLVYFIFIK